MTLKNIAVDGLTLAHALDSPITGGEFTITNSPLPGVRAGGAEVYESEVVFNFAKGTAPGADPETVSTAATGPQVIPTSATKCRPGVLEEDFVMMAAQGTLSGSPVAITGKVLIANAGQFVARGS